MDALAFSVGLLVILVAHESGHYFAARRVGMRPPLPVFLPGPPPFGTFGAVISVPDAALSRRDHLHVAAWGPVAGMLVALPLAVWGIAISDVRVVEHLSGDYMLLGTPLLFSALEGIFHGPLSPGEEVFLHPLAFAAWVGFFVTALNLLPMGPLDGGRVAWSVFGQRWRWPERGVVLMLIVLGFWLYPGWIVVSLLVVFLLGLGPAWTTEVRREPAWTGKDVVLACVCAGIFLVTFLPEPFRSP